MSRITVKLQVTFDFLHAAVDPRVLPQGQEVFRKFLDLMARLKKEEL